MNQITVELAQHSSTTSAARIRAHQVLIDRPTDKGGSDRGPMGGELFLVSIGGCFMSTLLAAVRARELPIADVATIVTGTLESAPARFSVVDLQVEAAASQEALEQLVEIADRSCIMMNTLRGKLEVRIHARARMPLETADSAKTSSR